MTGAITKVVRAVIFGLINRTGVQLDFDFLSPWRISSIQKNSLSWLNIAAKKGNERRYGD